MNTFRQIAATKRLSTKSLSQTIFSSSLNSVTTEAVRSIDPVNTFVAFPVRVVDSDGNRRVCHKTASELLREKRAWIDKSYRTANAESAVEQGIAWQLQVNRE